MSLRFDGTDDEVRCSPGGVALTGAMAIAVIVKRNSAVWGALIGGHNSGGTAAWQLWCRDDGRLFLDPGWSTSSAALGTGTWGLVGVSRTAGNATPRGHVYNGSTWTHQDMTNGSSGDYGSIAGGTVRFGEWEDGDDLDGWLEAAAVYQSNQADAAFEALVTNGTRAGWQATSPAGMWEFDDNPLVDVSASATANETVRTGTTAAPTDNPSFYVSGSGTLAVSPSLVMAPPIPT